MAVGVGLGNPKAQFLDDNGVPLASGKLYVYEPGTTTPRATYSNVGLSIANANPVILDAGGRAAIYFNPALSYKLVLTTSADVAVYTQDDVPGSALVGLSANSDGTAWTGRVLAATTQTPSVGAAGTGHTFGATLTKAGSGTHASFYGTVVSPPTINGGGATVTVAASLVVNGPPSGGVTNYALVVTGPGASIVQTELVLLTAVNKGITFNDSLETGAVATTITGYVGAYNADAGFVVRATSDDPLFLGSNNLNLMAIRPGGAVDFLDADVAHGMTDQAATTAYGQIAIVDGSSGAAAFRGFGESTQGIRIDGLVTTATSAAAVTTASVAPVIVAAYLKSGTTAGSVGANQLLMVIRDNATTRFAFDSDGDSHQDVGTSWSNYDYLDDYKALSSLAYHVSRDSDPFKESLRNQFGEDMEAWAGGREGLVQSRLVSFGPDGRPFVNMSKVTMLLVGAVRQAAREIRALDAQVEELKGRALAPKADYAALP